jgi:hypothetical protein
MPGCRPSCRRTAVLRACGALGPLMPPGPPAPHEDPVSLLAFAPDFLCRNVGVAVSRRGAHWLPGGRAGRTGWTRRTCGCSGHRPVALCRWGTRGPSRRDAPAAAASCPATGTTRRPPLAGARMRAPERPAHPSAEPSRVFQPVGDEPGRVAAEQSAGGAPRGRGAAWTCVEHVRGERVSCASLKGETGRRPALGPKPSDLLAGRRPRVG